MAWSSDWPIQPGSDWTKLSVIIQLWKALRERSLAVFNGNSYWGPDAAIPLPQLRADVPRYQGWGDDITVSSDYSPGPYDWLNRRYAQTGFSLRYVQGWIERNCHWFVNTHDYADGLDGDGARQTYTPATLWAAVGMNPAGWTRWYNAGNVRTLGYGLQAVGDEIGAVNLNELYACLNLLTVTYSINTPAAVYAASTSRWGYGEAYVRWQDYPTETEARVAAFVEAKAAAIADFRVRTTGGLINAGPQGPAAWTGCWLDGRGNYDGPPYYACAETGARTCQWSITPPTWTVNGAPVKRAVKFFYRPVIGYWGAQGESFGDWPHTGFTGNNQVSTIPATDATTVVSGTFGRATAPDLWATPNQELYNAGIKKYTTGDHYGDAYNVTANFDWAVNGVF